MNIFFKLVIITTQGMIALNSILCLSCWLSSKQCKFCFVLKNSSGKKRKKLEELDPLSYYEAIRDMKRKRKDERLKEHL